MSELCYCYDGSFEGFLCCIFESYAKKEIPTAFFCDEDFLQTLFAFRQIQTNEDHAKRVYRKIVKLSDFAASLLQRGFLTCLPEKELALYRLVKKLLQEGPSFLCNRSDETLYPVWSAVRKLEREVHLLKGFTRFSELGGVLGGEIAPKNSVLPLLRSHFCARYQGETFFLYDRTHQQVLLYSNGRAQIRPLADFQMAPPDEKEASYRLLWKRFYDTVAIQERENPVCRRTQMPMRYWSTMTEFQDQAFFTAQRSPADAAIPCAPAAKSVPGIPPAPEPSAPASVL